MATIFVLVRVARVGDDEPTVTTRLALSEAQAVGVLMELHGSGASPRAPGQRRGDLDDPDPDGLADQLSAVEGPWYHVERHDLDPRSLASA